MNNNPLVSICVPTFNNVGYIGKMLDSLVRQSYKNLEIIVCDNASTDNTEKIVKLFNDPRLFYYRSNTHLLTAEENYNQTLKYTKGDLIAIYHSDDIYEEDIVLNELTVLLENPKLGAVFTFADKINADGQPIGKIQVSRCFRNGGKYDFYRIFKALLIDGTTPLFCPSFMSSKETLRTAGIFNPQEFGTSADTEMYLRILEKSPVAIIPKIMVHYRIANSQVSSKYNYLRTDQAHFVKVANKFIRSPNLSIRQRNELENALEFQTGIDNIHRSVSYYITDRELPALELLKSTLSLKFIFLCFRKVRNIKYLFLAIAAIIGAGLKIRRIKVLVENIYNKRWKP